MSSSAIEVVVLFSQTLGDEEIEKQLMTWCDMESLRSQLSWARYNTTQQQDRKQSRVTTIYNNLWSRCSQAPYLASRIEEVTGQLATMPIILRIFQQFSSFLCMLSRATAIAKLHCCSTVDDEADYMDIKTTDRWKMQRSLNCHPILSPKPFLMH